MNDPVEQSRKILVDDLKTIQDRLNNMQTVIEKLPKNAPKRKELETAFQSLSREAAYVETMLSGLF